MEEKVRSVIEEVLIQTEKERDNIIYLIEDLKRLCEMGLSDVDSKKVKINIDEKTKSIETYGKIISRTTMKLNDKEGIVVKNPIKELKQEILLRKDEADREIITLVEAKKMFNSTDDKDICDKIEIMKLARLKDKNILNKLLDMVNKIHRDEDDKMVWCVKKRSALKEEIIGIFDDYDNAVRIKDETIKKEMKECGYIKDIVVHRYYLNRIDN